MADQYTKNREAFETVIKLAAHGGAMPKPIDNFFSLARCEANVDEWYFGIECPKCRRTTPIFRDFSEGKLGNAFSGSGGVRSQCYFCPEKIEAKANTIITLQWSTA